MIERLKRIKEGGNYFASPKTDVEFIRSGSKLLDLALGGGWSENRILNVVGDKSSGKTLIAIEASTNFANKHSKSEIDYRESEHAFLPEYAGALGMPLNRVNFGDKPLVTVEDLYNDLDKLLSRKRKVPHFYVCDSLDALSDSAEMDSEFGKSSYGAQKAKDMSKLFRTLNGQLSDAGITVMIISQIRDAIGVKFGEKTKRSGGRALDFYASQVAYLAQIGRLRKTVSKIERVTGIQIRAQIKKNKIGLPFREAEFSIMFGYGIDDAQACLQWLDKTKGKGQIGFGKTDEFLKTLNKMSEEAYFAKLDQIHSEVQKRWYVIENSLLPKRKKYGAQVDDDRGIRQSSAARKSKSSGDRQDQKGDEGQPG